MARTTRASRSPDQPDPPRGVTRTTASVDPSSTSPALPPESSPPELIVVGHLDAGLHITPTGATAAPGWELGELATIAADPAFTLEPLFGASEARVRASAPEAATAAQGVPLGLAMAAFYRVAAPEASFSELQELATRLLTSPAVEAAYVKPSSSAPVILDGAPAVVATTDAPPETPDFTARQGYLDAAPGGIDARWAWTQPGGRGGGVRIIDCEWGWRFTHEDLRVNTGGLVAGTASADTNHGTAVLGEISGDVNAVGITGITPDAVISASSFTSTPSATAIRAAADRLGQGDIILLEIHRSGPGANGSGQDGFIAVEWWPDDYLAIRYAVERGIVVVEAAGNGDRNLDDAIYDRSLGFPAWWRNPFRRRELDSGAVVVGAGAPPSGNQGPDRSRLGFSNHGAVVDAQGWGREVTTTGYGWLQGGTNEDLWYTNDFSGTSSASPIVVGAVAAVQGALRAAGRPPLSPARARELLRATGSAQQDAPGRPATQRIGTRPNLRQLIPAALANAQWTGTQFTGSLGPNATARWFTFGWPAHWHVVWTALPTSPRPGAPQISFRTRVERASDAHATYWIEITNLTNTPVNVEGRFAVLGW